MVVYHLACIPIHTLHLYVINKMKMIFYHKNEWALMIRILQHKHFSVLQL